MMRGSLDREVRGNPAPGAKQRLGCAYTGPAIPKIRPHRVDLLYLIDNIGEIEEISLS